MQSAKHQDLVETSCRAGGLSVVPLEERPILSRAVTYAAKRSLDLVVSLLLLFLLSPLLAAIALAVRLTSKGSILYWSDRVGHNNRIFRMPKFRTMNMNVPEVATHLLPNPEAYLTVIGSFLRRTSLDELPQIYSILRGQLSLVGPRPALHNQFDLIALRTERGVHELLPGLTGWAQVNGRDDLSIRAKVDCDSEYMRRRTFLFDLRILFLTLFRVIRRNGVAH